MLGLVCVLAVAALASARVPQPVESPSTFCNPINVDYRIMNEQLLYREAADPVALYYDGDYYIFASKCGGYYWSPDFYNWTLVTPSNLPLENWAPAALEYKGALLWMTSFGGKLYRSTEPKKAGSWQVVGNVRGDQDPALFLDDNGRVYLSYGCSNVNSIHIVELDPAQSFKEIGKTAVCASRDEKHRGWEINDDFNIPHNTSDDAPWIEGSWMTKHNGVYYMQYAAPGASHPGYGDGVYTSNNPLGPFTYQQYSPWSYKCTGFMAGSGHSATFLDASGKHWWHIATSVVSVVHMFERRMSLSPVSFDNAGRIHSDTFRGDLPQYLPGKHPSGEPDTGVGANLAGWELLSYGKHVTVSSTNGGHVAKNAVDENIKTFWCASSGKPGEYLELDLGKAHTVRAIQVNFAEVDISVRGRDKELYQQYKVDASLDGTTWDTVIDTTDRKKDAPHDYFELDGPLEAQYLRITNHATENKVRGKFALRDFRIFGLGHGTVPSAVQNFKVSIDSRDKRHGTATWSAVSGAVGYVVSYGIGKDAINTHWEVRGSTSLDVHALFDGAVYSWTIQPFNENGLGPLTTL